MATELKRELSDEKLQKACLNLGQSDNESEQKMKPGNEKMLPSTDSEAEQTQSDTDFAESNAMADDLFEEMKVEVARKIKEEDVIEYLLKKVEFAEMRFQQVYRRLETLENIEINKWRAFKEKLSLHESGKKNAGENVSVGEDKRDDSTLTIKTKPKSKPNSVSDFTDWKNNHCKKDLGARVWILLLIIQIFSLPIRWPIPIQIIQLILCSFAVDAIEYNYAFSSQKIHFPLLYKIRKIQVYCLFYAGMFFLSLIIDYFVWRPVVETFSFKF